MIYLTPAQAADRLGMSPRTLERWRLERVGPAYHKLGRKTVRYRADELDSWAAARIVDPHNAPVAA